MPTPKENLLATVEVTKKLVVESKKVALLRQQIDARRKLEAQLESKTTGEETAPEDET